MPSSSTVRQWTLPKRQWAPPDTTAVPILAAWMTAEAAAAVAPPATRTEVPITPNPMPSEPSIICATKPATQEDEQAFHGRSWASRSGAGAGTSPEPEISPLSHGEAGQVNRSADLNREELYPDRVPGSQSGPEIPRRVGGSAGWVVRDFLPWRPNTLHYEDTQVEITKLVVGPMDNNVFVVRCRQTGEAVLLDAANEHEKLLELCERG